MDFSDCYGVYGQDFERFRAQHPSPDSRLLQDSDPFCLFASCFSRQLITFLNCSGAVNKPLSRTRNSSTSALCPVPQNTWDPFSAARLRRASQLHTFPLPTAGTQMCNKNCVVLLCRRPPPSPPRRKTSKNNPTQSFPTAAIHLPHAHLLLEHIGEILLPLAALVVAVAALLVLVVPAKVGRTPALKIRSAAGASLRKLQKARRSPPPPCLSKP